MFSLIVQRVPKEGGSSRGLLQVYVGVHRGLARLALRFWTFRFSTTAEASPAAAKTVITASHRLPR
jgi:hypothetical protein